jgi:hypothetical protein
MNEEMIRRRIEADRGLAERDQREMVRWILLLAANINRPIKSTLGFLVKVIKSEYLGVTEVQVRRELDYLQSRDLLHIFTDQLGQVSVDLTRFGIDIAEYTVAVEPGIARPPKV